MTEIPEHLRVRAQEARQKAAAATPPAQVLRFDPHRTTNARAVINAVQLGWVPGPGRFQDRPVLDMTYGPAGGFWTEYKPLGLVTNDLHSGNTDLDYDYLKPLPPDMHNRFWSVLYDPPYELKGGRSAAGSHAQDARYGNAGDEYRPVAQVHREMLTGLLNAASCVGPPEQHQLLDHNGEPVFTGTGANRKPKMFDYGGWLLVKCQQQRSSNRWWDQPRFVTDALQALHHYRWWHQGVIEVGRANSRAGGKGKNPHQSTPRNITSQLLCFQRKATPYPDRLDRVGRYDEWVDLAMEEMGLADAA